METQYRQIEKSKVMEIRDHYAISLPIYYDQLLSSLNSFILECSKLSGFFSDNLTDGQLTDIETWSRDAVYFMDHVFGKLSPHETKYYAGVWLENLNSLKEKFPIERFIEKK